MSKKLLIACYFFPPCPSIGGRRSAKFAKYLSKKGDQVFVIQAVNPFPSVSPWMKDISTEGSITRIELPLNYPVEFILPPINLAGKLKYRFYRLFFDIFHPTKNKFDYTFFWKKIFLKKAEELILSHNIKNVLISGPPFYYAHYSIKLKEKFPDLNIIVDFRDPWIGSPYYGMSSLKQKQQDYEIKLLNEVYKKADYFIGPNSFLLQEQLAHIYPNNTQGAKVIEVPHGFDLDELTDYINLNTLNANDKIKLVYGGQLYPGTESLLIALQSLLTEIKTTNPNLYKRLQFDFYTPETHKKLLFEEHKECVFFHEPVGNKIMSKIAEGSICLIILANHNKDYRTTKFLEYSVLRKPFCVFGPKGYVSKFVEDNNLGKAFEEDNLKEFSSFLENFSEFLNKQFNLEYDFSEHELSKVTETLRNLLN